MAKTRIGRGNSIRVPRHWDHRAWYALWDAMHMGVIYLEEERGWSVKVVFEDNTIDSWAANASEVQSRAFAIKAKLVDEAYRESHQLREVF